MAILFGVWFLLLLINTPVAFSLSITSLIYLLIKNEILLSIPERMAAAPDSFPLLAVPFFILAGNLMNIGGITKRIFRFASCLVGHITGGLGHVNVMASMIFAGMSGSALADTIGLGTIEMKAMLEDGFDADFSAGITLASSTIGPIIPPSIPMVICGPLMEVSVGALFIGGVIPGALMGIALMILAYFIARKRNYPRHTRATLSEFLVAFKEAFLALLTPVIIMGGILLGIFTPTEAAIVAVIYALILGMLVYRELKVSDLSAIILQTVETTAMVIFIVCSASLFGWILGREQIPQKIAGFVLSFSTNPTVVLFIINIFLLIVGCFMEGIAAMIILIPVFIPIIARVGIDPVHFGVVLVLNLMIGLLTPPFGLGLYSISRVANISFERATKAVLPFLMPLIVVLFLISFFPALVLFLPHLVFK